jgi:molecular chaperone GrpE
MKPKKDHPTAPDTPPPPPGEDEAPVPTQDGATAVPAPDAPESDATEAARAQVTALEDRLRRQQADFLNDVRRIQRQADERVRFAVQPVVTDLLGVADALHGAVEGLKDSEHERRVAEGLRLVERQLLEALSRHGVARIEALHKPFDPAFHEAVMEVEGDGEGRTVVQVTRPGFTLHGRVVRPASVVVSRPKPPAAGGGPVPEE